MPSSNSFRAKLYLGFGVGLISQDRDPFLWETVTYLGTWLLRKTVCFIASDRNFILFCGLSLFFFYQTTNFEYWPHSFLAVWRTIRFSVSLGFRWGSSTMSSGQCLEQNRCSINVYIERMSKAPFNSKSNVWPILLLERKRSLKLLCIWMVLKKNVMILQALILQWTSGWYGQIEELLSLAKIIHKFPVPGLYGVRLWES